MPGVDPTDSRDRRSWSLERCSWCGHEMSPLPRKSGGSCHPAGGGGELKIYILKYLKKKIPSLLC